LPGYPEGNTRDRAARRLGWSLTTLKRRLEKGRDQLRERLTRRGLGLPAVLLVAGVTEGPSLAAVPLQLAGATVRAAGGSSLPPSVAALVMQTLPVVTARTGRAAASMVLAAGLLLVGGVLLAGPRAEKTFPAQPPKPLPVRERVRKVEPKTAEETKQTKELHVKVRVVDEKDRPIAEASVALVVIWLPPKTGESYKDEVVHQGKTDREGRCQFTLAGDDPNRTHWLHL